MITLRSGLLNPPPSRRHRVACVISGGRAWYYVLPDDGPLPRDTEEVMQMATHLPGNVLYENWDVAVSFEEVSMYYVKVSHPEHGIAFVPVATPELPDPLTVATLQTAQIGCARDYAPSERVLGELTITV